MATKQEGVEQLGRVPMFSSLSKKQLSRLWDRMKIIHHSPGHVIVHEGRGGHGFHIVLEGTVRVERPGKKITLGPGQFFGEMSLIDEGPRTANVTAETDVQIATLTSGEFRYVAKKEPELLWKLLVHTTERLRAEQSAAANLTA